MDKPPGIPVQAIDSYHAQGLPELPQDLLSLSREYIRTRYNKPGEVYLAMLHRLDRGVGGAVLFAKTSKAAARLSSQFQKHTVKKTYRAIVHGKPKKTGDTLEDWLIKDEKLRLAKSSREGKRAVLSYETLKTLLHPQKGELSLLEVDLKTGRFHQIRFQLSKMGCPILGDVKYGAPAGLSDFQIALHSTGLEVDHPTRKEPIAFQSELPELFKTFVPLP